MKRVLLFLVLFCSFAVSFAQPVINRTLGTNTVTDPRWMARLNLFAPRYADTTAANLQKGIDSCGALIYTYNVDGFWYRQCFPKKWVRFSAASSGVQSVTGTAVNITDPLNPVINLRRFGLEDNSSAADRSMNMNQHILNLNGASSIYIGTMDIGAGGVSSALNLVTNNSSIDQTDNAFTLRYKFVPAFKRQGDYYVPLSVNGNVADDTGNISITGDGAGLLHVVAGTKLSQVNDSTIKLADSVWQNIYERLSEKLNLSDTAAAWTNYAAKINLHTDSINSIHSQIVGLASTSATHTSDIATNATNIALKLNKSDTAAMLANDRTKINIHTDSINSIHAQIVGLASTSATHTSDIAANTSAIATKQASLSGTGFIKATGTTISYDNSTYQPLNSNLTTIAGLTATTDNFLIGASSAWASRTPTQAKASLAYILASTDYTGQGTTTTLLHGNASGAPSWGAVALTTDVSGILGSTNGGSGINNAGTLTWGAGGTLGTAAYTASTAYEVPLTISTGLTRSTNTVTNNLITGLAGGQTIIGGTASGENLTLTSTSNATKGFIYLGAAQTSGFDGVNSRIGILSAVPTHSLTIGSTGTGMAIYNTSDQTTNYERARMYWNSNVFTVSTEIGGTGTARVLALTGNGKTLSIGNATTSGFFNFGIGTGVINTAGLGVTGTFTTTSGTSVAATISPTYNQSTSTAANTDLLINRTETSVGSGAQNLIDAQVATVSKFKVDNKGKITQSTTTTAAGTTGNQTINNPTGTVNIAAAGTSVVLTNSLISATSLVRAWVRTNDANKTYVYAVVPASGSCTIYVANPSAAEISIGFEVLN